MNYKNIYISTYDLYKIADAVKEHAGDNPACILGKYWRERMNPQMIDAMQEDEKRKMPYGFVGSGWPEKSDQSAALQYDKLGLANTYSEVNCRDIGDAIYQGNILIPYLMEKVGMAAKRMLVVDIGAGYGRLAIPFLYAMRGLISYIMVDYTQIGLLTAGQFIKQWYPKSKVLSWNEKGDFTKYDCVSLPAWRLDELNDYAVDMLISVHSLQEMEQETIDFYVDIINKRIGAYFYSVNIDKDITYINDSWQTIFSRSFPVNRDGRYDEKLWLVK